MSEKPNTPQQLTSSDSAEPDLAPMERMLKTQLDQADKNPRDVLWQLARLYQATKRPDEALQCLRRILASESDLEVKAGCAGRVPGASHRPSFGGEKAPRDHY